MSESTILDTFRNPTVWCESYLRNPRDREEPLTLRSYQRDITDNTFEQQNIILQWGRRLGKCLRGKSKIINKLGELVKVDSLINKDDFGVISLDNNLSFESTDKTRCVSNGVKDIYRLTTRSGRRVDVTENHPFLTPSGWKQLNEVKVGNSISVPVAIKLGLTKEIEDYKVKLLAYLLADGCITSSIRFGNNIDKIKTEFLECVSEFDCDYRITKTEGNYKEFIIRGNLLYGNRHEPNHILNYIRSLDLIGKNSHTKFIPNEIMTLSKRQQGIFLSRLYGCDGWASVSKRKSDRKSGMCEIGYCSVSEELVYGVAHLLTRFGIRYFINEKKVKYKNTVRKAYQLCIWCKKDILTFLDTIGIYGKEDACNKIRQELNIKNDKETYFDSVPFDLLEQFNIKTPRKYNRVSKFKIIKYAREHKLDDLLQICESDTFFDEIKSIKYLCKEETYDIQADPYNNYIVNDIIVHNSVVMCADCLWWAQAWPLVDMITNKRKKQKPFTVLVFAPYEAQVKELWNTFTQLIGDSPLLKDQVKKIRTSDVHLIEFNGQDGNPGSVIKGYTIGISSANQGTSLRGLSGDMIFIDEMDFIPTSIIEQVILPITTTHPDVKRRICSTPSGKREMYFQWCSTANELGWKHSHFPSWHPDNDRWLSIADARSQGKRIQDSTEFQVKEVTTAAAYIREYGAEFGEEFGGVYKHHFINSSMIKYGRGIDLTDPDIFDPGFEQNSEHKYIMGVDWNTYINGGQIVIVEFCTTPTLVHYFDDDKKEEVSIDFTGKYRLFYRRGIKSKDATQRLTRQEIIRLMTYWKIDYVYVDYGAGDTNIEELSLYGRSHPDLLLDRKLRVIDAGSTVEHYDHILQKMVKKRNKSLMINFSALSLEEGMFVLPKEEDTPTRLIGQMRGYTIKNITARGDYSYEGEDHILDAFNLAIYGFQQNYGHLLSSKVTYVISSLADPRTDNYPKRINTIAEAGPKHFAFNGSSNYYNSYTNIVDPEKKTHRSAPRRAVFPGVGSRTRALNLRQGTRGSF